MNETTAMNDLQMAEEESKIPLSERLPIALLYLLLIASGLSGYAIVILGFIRDRKEYAKVQFYKLIYTLAAGDVGLLLIELMMLPVVFSGEPVYGEGLLHYALGWLEGVSFIVLLYASLLIAFNRFCVFVLSPTHDVTTFLFERHIHKMCMLPWLFASVLKTAAAYYGIFAIYSHRKFYWSFTLIWPLPPLGFTYLNLLFYHNVVVIPLGMFCMYVVVFVVLRFGKWRLEQASSEETRKRASRELRLLLQAAVICALLEGGCLSFHLSIGGVAANVISIMNSAANPFIFLIFNSTVRASVKKICGIADNKVAVVVEMTQAKE